jgi:dipeptidyl aminopeptidase/acylaminoacyl peptidase
MEKPELTILDLRAGTSSQVTLGVPGTFFWEIDWSKAGLLVVASQPDGGFSIWIADVATGHSARRVVHEPGEIVAARWSPEGDAIYYARPSPSKLLRVAIAADGTPGEPTIVDDAPIDENGLAVAKDGRLLYARQHGGGDLWLVALADDGIAVASKRRLTDTPGMTTTASVSPDGRMVAFDRTVAHGSEIFVRPLDGGAARQVTSLGANSHAPVWSPDGTTLAFVSDADGSLRVWLVDVRGAAPRALSTTLVSDEELLEWAPGQLLYGKADNTDFGVIDASTSAEKPLLGAASAGGHAYTPRWRADGARVAIYLIRGADKTGIWTLDGKGMLEGELRPGREVPVGWAPDGRLYVSTGVGDLERIATDGSSGSARVAWPADPSIDPQRTTPDGRGVLAISAVETQIWIGTP